MTQANDERAARKEYIRRRQKTVFSIVGAVMVVAMVVSLLFFFHVGGLGNVKSAAVQPNYGQQAPCPIKEADGNKAKYVENRNITLRVLNGTKFSGFAKAVSDALQNREFNPQTPDNYTKKVDRTMIVFGTQLNAFLLTNQLHDFFRCSRFRQIDCFTVSRNTRTLTDHVHIRPDVFMSRADMCKRLDIVKINISQTQEHTNQVLVTVAGIHSFTHQIACTCIVIATLFFTTTSAISEIYYIIAFCSIKPF